MKKEYKKLIGELIGLARAIDGNEHLILPSTTLLIRECLLAIEEGTADPEYYTTNVIEEKRKVVPNCFVCANPCGRTSPFDLNELPEGEIRELKLSLLDTLCRSANDIREDILYRDLVIISLEDYTPQDLLPLIDELT